MALLHRPVLATGFALAAASMYGIVPNFVRAAYQTGIPPVEATLVRTSVIAMLFAAIAGITGQSLRIPPAAYRVLAIQAAATLVVSVCYLASVQFIPVGLAVIIFFTFPVLILVGAPLAEGHRPDFSRILLALAALAGLAVAIVPGALALDLRGVALAALASAGATAQFFSGRRMAGFMTPVAFGSIVHLVIWPFTLAMALVVGDGTLQLFRGNDLPGPAFTLLAGVAIAYAAAYFLHMMALRTAPASTVAPFFNLEPVVTTLVAAVLLGERLAPNQYAGGAVIFAALIAAGRSGTRKPVS
jgi:drug/metabolite transporter (DMT)-like permease